MEEEEIQNLLKAANYFTVLTIATGSQRHEMALASSFGRIRPLFLSFSSEVEGDAP